MIRLISLSVFPSLCFIHANTHTHVVFNNGTVSIIHWFSPTLQNTLWQPHSFFTISISVSMATFSISKNPETHDKELVEKRMRWRERGSKEPRPDGHSVLNEHAALYSEYSNTSGNVPLCSLSLSRSCTHTCTEETFALRESFKTFIYKFDVIKFIEIHHKSICIYRSTCT